MSEYILTHKHQTHPHAASGWRIHCGVEVTELSTNKQHTLSLRYHILLQLFKSFGDEKSSFEFWFFISLTFPQLFSCVPFHHHLLVVVERDLNSKENFPRTVAALKHPFSGISLHVYLGLLQYYYSINTTNILRISLQKRN